MKKQTNLPFDLSDVFACELRSYQQFKGNFIPRADTSSAENTHKNLKRLSEFRGQEAFYPYLGSGRGHGPFVEMEDGSVKMDWITGIGVHFFGHSNPAFIKAGIEAAFQNIAMQGHLQQNSHCVSLQTKILHLANRYLSRFKHVFLSTSGAMANENALKILFSKTKGERLLAFRGNFCGRTLGLATVTDKAENRPGLPLAFPVDYIPFYNSDSPKHGTLAAVSRLEEYLARYPGKYAGMIFEMIQGEGGFYPGEKTYFTALMEILKKHQIPIWVDEIQTFGRTEKPFAFQTMQLDHFVDIITIGKMTQICATVYTKDMAPPAGLLSQTFTGATQTLKVAETVFDLLDATPLFGPEGLNISWHQVFVKHMKRLQKKYPSLITPPFGIGSMWAFTFSDGSKNTCMTFLKHLYHEGLIGFMCGKAPYRIRFLPPTPCLDHSHFKIAFRCIENAIQKMQ